MAQTRTAAIYCRTAYKDDSVIESQKAGLTQNAKARGYDRLLVFTDNGAIGTNFNRHGWRQLNTAIDNGTVGAVFVRNISRISRNFILMEQWIEQLQSKGVNLIAVDDNIFVGGNGYGT
jgi:DNA invertase Pin-like site-specific DNA recombinase